MKVLKGTTLIVVLFITASLGQVCKGQSAELEKKTDVQVEGVKRTIHFLEDSSLGVLYVLDGNQVGKSSDSSWEPLCEATGKVIVPAGKVLRLDLSKEASTDLSPLSALGPNDLVVLCCRGTNISDEGLKHISHLTGLQEIDLSDTEISGAGLKYLTNLKSLKRLDLSNTHVGDDKLAYLLDLPSLEILSLRMTPVTDAGMVHVGKITSLTALGLSSGVGNEGLSYLKGLTSLQWLSTSNQEINDEGLAHLADLTQMETLYISNTQVSDAGLVYLKKMAKLKILFLYGTRVTEKGLVHLESFQDLERLELLYGVTDAGLMTLSKLPSLKNITIDGDSITKEGLSLLPKMKSLEHVYVDNTDKMDAIIGELVELPRIKKLTIGRGLTDEGLIQIKKMQSLQELYIIKGQITSKGIAALAELPSLRMLTLDAVKLSSEKEWEALGNLSSLQDLSLTRCRSEITDENIAHLTSLRFLKDLFIYGVVITDRKARKAAYSSNITDKGLMHILKFEALEQLCLNGAKITDKGLQQLEGLSCLKLISVQGCDNVTEEGIQKLRKKLPTLRWWYL